MEIHVELDYKAIGLALFLGICWGGLNVYFIRHLLLSLLIEKPVNPLKATLLILLKFPLLYYAGYLILSLKSVSPGYLLIGVFCGFVLVARGWVLKALRGT